MVNVESIITRDLNHIWHPCTAMKELEQQPPLVINSARGSIIHTNKGPLIDAISSWWCKSLGHGHPAIISAIQKQLNTFEHVIGAHTTHEQRALFGEFIAEITGKQHVFLASDGACAVEIAMKLALHTQKLRGQHHKTEFIALEHGYHGETLGTLAVSDLGVYKKAYEGFGPTTHFIKNLPYVSGVDDPLWSNCESHWQQTLPVLNLIKDKVCAVIVEPIVQGAAGMKCYSADFLKRLSSWAQQHQILVIADEIMTGIGRTGKWLASSHAGIVPDLVCLSKGLTSGSIPLSCVAIDHDIYELFYHQNKAQDQFLHSHTYSGNPLALAAAVATIKTIKNDQIMEQADTLGHYMLKCVQEIATTTGRMSNVRSMGLIVAADMESAPDYRIGQRIAKEAMTLGALLRPIGNTLYWLPPLNIDKKTIGNLAEITLNSIHRAYKNTTYD